MTVAVQPVNNHNNYTKDKIHPTYLSTLINNIQCEQRTNLTANRNCNIPYRNLIDIWYSGTTQQNNKQFNGSNDKYNDKHNKHIKRNNCH